METVITFYNGPIGTAGRQPGLPVGIQEGPDGFTPAGGRRQKPPTFVNVRIQNCKKADVERFIGSYTEWDELKAIPEPKFHLRSRYLLRLDQLTAQQRADLEGGELVLPDKAAFNFLLADRILTAREAFNLGTPLEG